ncbi:hypothetical protein J6590_064613 [Homalodisca vitripennis]|nr:hypothetical protein J6590_064613 [Homalodisca vitripennis]
MGRVRPFCIQLLGLKEGNLFHQWSLNDLLMALKQKVRKALELQGGDLVQNADPYEFSSHSRSILVYEVWLLNNGTDAAVERVRMRQPTMTNSCVV